ncbi:MAG TPA: SRPBCC family protein [Chitinophagaceae bacterium]|nr:SRPBCC family protein [Chitinophagaceae bacterium]
MAYSAINEMKAFPEGQYGSGPAKNVGTTERIISAVLGSWMLISAFGNSKKLIGRTSRLGMAGYLLYRGISGNCPVYSAVGMKTLRSKAIELRTSLTVNKPKDEVFRYWRNLENLPIFMEHLKSVKETDYNRSHWEAKIPGNIGTIEWEAEITDERPGELIAWQSVDNATIFNSGHVSFRDTLGDMGTVVTVRIIYQPPAGNPGAVTAKLLNPIFEKMVRADIVRFKQVIEFGDLTKEPAS